MDTMNLDDLHEELAKLTDLRWQRARMREIEAAENTLREQLPPKWDIRCVGDLGCYVLVPRFPDDDEERSLRVPFLS